MSRQRPTGSLGSRRSLLRDFTAGAHHTCLPATSPSSMSASPWAPTLGSGQTSLCLKVQHPLGSGQLTRVLPPPRPPCKHERETHRFGLVSVSFGGLKRRVALKQVPIPHLTADGKEPMEGAQAPSKSSKQREEKTAPLRNQEPGPGLGGWGELCKSLVQSFLRGNDPPVSTR